MGDPACFLDATCFTCGRFLELDDHRLGSCRCGEPIDQRSQVTAENLHRRLKDDLFSAMKDRDRDRVDALRLAVAALDNAGAVQFEARSSLLPPLTGLSTDVERKQLAEGEGIALLQTEVEHLLESAESNAAAGRDHEAGRHRRMADILEAYLRP